MYKRSAPRGSALARIQRCALLVGALGSGACHPHAEAGPSSDAAPPSFITAITDAASPATSTADASPTTPPAADAGPPEPRTVYLGPRPTLAAVCADADAWYAKKSHRPKSRVCLLHGPRALSGDRFLEAADYAMPSPFAFSERPANAYEPFLALRTAQGWFVQPSDSFPMAVGAREVWIPLDRIVERDGELVVVRVENERGEKRERELHCTLTDGGAPSCTDFTSTTPISPAGDAGP